MYAVYELLCRFSTKLSLILLQTVMSPITFEVRNLDPLSFSSLNQLDGAAEFIMEGPNPILINEGSFSSDVTNHVDCHA